MRGGMMLTVGEVAALLRVRPEDVVVGLASGNLPAVKREGSVLVMGDAMWAQLDPEAVSVPRRLVQSARLTVARTESGSASWSSGGR
jgi:hypothetical protein